jgi:hypothetical protein
MLLLNSPSKVSTTLRLLFSYKHLAIFQIVPDLAGLFQKPIVDYSH